jgi:DNA-binding NarL/FixJ family response regulator
MPQVKRSSAARYGQPLTDLEEELISLLFESLGPKRIAEDLGLSSGTIRSKLHAAYEKLGVANSLDLITRSISEGGFNLWAYGRTFTPRAKRNGSVSPRI